MTNEREQWEEALAFERRQGEHADAYVAERITQLASVGDVTGVERILAVAGLLDRLRRGSPQ